MRGIERCAGAVLVALLLGCGGDDLPQEEDVGNNTTVAMTGDRDPDSPEGVVRRWMDAEEGSDEWLRLHVRSARETLGKGKSKAFVPSNLANAQHRVEIGQAEIDGDRAEVPITAETKGPGVDTKTTIWQVLVREEGEWRIDPFAMPRHEPTFTGPLDPEITTRNMEESKAWMRQQIPVRAAYEDLANIRQRVVEFWSSTGHPLPRSMDELAARFPDVPRVDPWGNPYYLWVADDGRTEFDVHVRSFGSDGKEGGEGDAADIEQ